VTRGHRGVRVGSVAMGCDPSRGATAPTASCWSRAVAVLQACLPTGVGGWCASLVELWRVVRPDFVVLILGGLTLD